MQRTAWTQMLGIRLKRMRKFGTVMMRFLICDSDRHFHKMAMLCKMKAVPRNTSCVQNNSVKDFKVTYFGIKMSLLTPPTCTGKWVDGGIYCPSFSVYRIKETIQPYYIYNITLCHSNTFFLAGTSQ